MSNKHTQGNWKVVEIHNNKTKSFQITIDDEHSVIATVHTNIYDERIEFEESKANAKLIAAAPELLEALQMLSVAIENGDVGDITDVLLTYGRPAINKATL